MLGFGIHVKMILTSVRSLLILLAIIVTVCAFDYGYMFILFIMHMAKEKFRVYFIFFKRTLKI